MDALKKKKGILLCKVIVIIAITLLISLWVFKPDKYVLISVVSISALIISIFAVYLPTDGYWTNISIIGGFCFTITGWFFSNYFNYQAAIFQNNLTNENSIKNAQREIKIKYLLDSYLKIAYGPFVPRVGPTISQIISLNPPTVPSLALSKTHFHPRDSR